MLVRCAGEVNRFRPKKSAPKTLSRLHITLTDSLHQIIIDGTPPTRGAYRQVQVHG